MKRKILYFTMWSIILISQGNLIEKFHSPSAVVDALVHIFKYCGNKYNTIDVIDNNGSIAQSLSILLPLASIALYKDFKTPKQPIKFYRKIDAIIINIESLDIFTYFFRKFYNFPWWNIEPSYFILDNRNDTFYNSSLKVNIYFLQVPKVLYFLTCNEQNLVMVHTINQFSSSAPFSWNLTYTIADVGFIYSKLFSKQSICHEFYYNRIRHIYSQNIHMCSWELPDNQDYPKYITTHKNLLKIPYKYQLHAEALMAELNLSVSYRAFLRPLVENSKMNYLRWLLLRTPVHLLIWDFPTFSGRFEGVTFPIRFYQLNFLVHHRGYKTSFEKIRDYYGIWICLSLIFILFITFIVLKLINKKKDLGFTLFEILRFLINTAIITPINSNSLKIFLSMIFLYFFILHATFSGHLVEFLTKLEPRKNAESLEDLKDPQYKLILYPHIISQYITNLGLNDKARPYEDISQCMAEIALSKSIVCIGDDSDLSVYFTSSKSKNKVTIHKPQNGFGFFYMLGQARRGTLESRINKIFIHVFESGLDNFVQNRDKKKIIEHEKRKLALNNPKFTSINVEMLKPAFIALGVGLACAVISFIVEVLIKKN